MKEDHLTLRFVGEPWSQFPLFYGRAKASADRLYHVMPRTGPATP
jgi:hypothetical protein